VSNTTSSMWMNVATDFKPQQLSARTRYLLERLVAKHRARKMVNDLAAIDLRTWSDIGLPPIPKSHVSWALSPRGQCN